MHLQIFLHAHQPVGNFDFVFEDNYQKSYKPLLDILCKFPDIKLNLHYSGILLQWLESNHPDYTEKLKVLVKNRQVELLSGGFYEPILSSIPVRDIIGQIQKMDDYVGLATKTDSKSYAQNFRSIRCPKSREKKQAQKKPELLFQVYDHENKADGCFTGLIELSHHPVQSVCPFPFAKLAFNLNPSTELRDHPFPEILSCFPFSQNVKRNKKAVISSKNIDRTIRRKNTTEVFDL